MDEKMILDLLKEVREDQKKQGKELIHHGVTLVNMGETLEKQEENMREHMKRTDMLENLHKDNQNMIVMNKQILKGTPDKPGLTARVEKLEEPGKFKSAFWGKAVKIAGYISALGGAGVIILKLLGKM